MQEYVKNKVGSKANIYVGNTFEMCITEQDLKEAYKKAMTCSIRMVKKSLKRITEEI